MPDMERIARRHYKELPYRDQLAVLEWIDRGSSWSDALVYSGVLATTSARVSPYQAARERENEERARAIASNAERFVLFGGRRQASEHEAAHIVVGKALGLKVKGGYVVGSSGWCMYEGGTPFQTATIASAGEHWISVFRSQEFPGGAFGCASDRRAVLTALRDDWEIAKAIRACHEMLRDNVATVLAVSDRIEADGRYVL